MLKIFFLMLTLIIPLTQFAYGDYLEYNNFHIESEKPDICITEPEDPTIDFYNMGYFNATMLAVAEWEYRLLKENTNFDMNIHYILNKTHHNKNFDDFRWCDVFVLFEKQSDTRTLGFTAYKFNDSKHKFSMIVIYTQQNYTKNIIDIGRHEIVEKSFFEVFDLKFVNKIVKHEFGHALGLGHKFRTIDNHFDSIMKPYPGKINIITKHDIQAVKLLYPDGFQRFYNEPIPELYSP